MQRLIYILFQLDQARHYIQDGRLAHLRLALLLLDNAAEMHMEQQISAKLFYEEFNERMKERLGDIPGDLPPSLKEIAEWQPLSRGQKVKVRRDFNEAIKFLSERHSCLDQRFAGCLSYLHRYRNEAYHRARVRSETIRTAALLLFEVNCQMLLSMRPPMIGWSSNEDYSWFEERFGIPAIKFTSSSGLAEIVQEVRTDILLTDEVVKTVLKEHLDNRIADLHGSLDFIAESTPGGGSREEALRDSQWAYDVEHGKIEFVMGGWEKYKAKHTLDSIKEIGYRSSEILVAKDCLDAFLAFAEIEKELEVIEAPVMLLEAEADKEIQLQIDIARGK